MIYIDSCWPAWKSMANASHCRWPCNSASAHVVLGCDFDLLVQYWELIEIGDVISLATSTRILHRGASRDSMSQCNGSFHRRRVILRYAVYEWPWRVSKWPSNDVFSVISSNDVMSLQNQTAIGLSYADECWVMCAQCPIAGNASVAFNWTQQYVDAHTSVA